MYSIDTTTGKLTSMGTVDAGGDVLPPGRASFPQLRLRGCRPFRLPWPCVSVHGGRGDRALASNGTEPTEGCPRSIVIDPSGKLPNVANYDSHSISMYTIDAVTGTLTLIGTVGT